jgi:hypothetical protein
MLRLILGCEQRMTGEESPDYLIVRPKLKYYNHTALIAIRLVELIIRKKFSLTLLTDGSFTIVPYTQAAL